MKKQQLINQIGFTTQTFVNFIEDKSISVKDLIEWAADQGFKWVEVRDPQIKMSKEYLKIIKNQAEHLGIRIHYAWDGTNILNADHEYSIRKGIENAEIFGKDTMSRIVIAPSNITEEESKLGYSADEFLQVSKTISKYNKIAASHGVTLVYENSVEPILGDKKLYFGMTEIMKENPEMKITFDPANSMCKDNARVPAKEGQVVSFSKNYSNQIPYIHIKSTEGNILQSNLLLKADFDILEILSILNDSTLACVELPPETDLRLCKEKVINAKNMLIQNLQ